MHDIDEQWVLRPVALGMCRYESLLDGTLSLDDIEMMNEYATVDQENQNRANKAMRPRDG